MAQTRAQRAAKRERDPDSQDQVAPERKRQNRKASTAPRAQGKGRKQAVQDTPEPAPPQQSPPTPPVAETAEEAADDPDPNSNPIGYWARKGVWPAKYFELDMEEAYERAYARDRPLVRRRASDSATSTVTPSDERPREEKTAQYRDSRYVVLLETKGSFMKPSKFGITVDSKDTYMALLTSKQTFPTESLFRDDLFMRTCEAVQGRNEARVLRDISPLIVPSAETLTIYGSTGLECLVDGVNEGWNNSIPLLGARPQPDYSVGFRRQAFTDLQLTKLSPFVGNYLAGDLSFFMATFRMYFPFLTSEVKCGATGLDTADKQNAHSMTLAVRGVVELFRLVERENELHRQILAFSISHDDRSVRIFGHYPEIEGKDTKYYRHPIREYYLMDMDGQSKWAAYQFVRNVYDHWMPRHFKSICSAIDQLPEKIDFAAKEPAQSAGVPQDLGSQPAVSQVDSASLLVDQDDQSGRPGPMAPPAPPAKKRRTPAN